MKFGLKNSKLGLGLPVETAWYYGWLVGV